MSRDHDEGVSWGNESSSSTGMMPEILRVILDTSHQFDYNKDYEVEDDCEWNSMLGGIETSNVDLEDDICQLSLKNLTDEEVKLMQFVSLTWHEFYCWFAKFNGFTMIFVVLDIEEDENVPIILGCQFLNTCDMVIKTKDPTNALVEASFTSVGIENPLEIVLIAEDLDSDSSNDEEEILMFLQAQSDVKPMRNERFEESKMSNEPKPKPSIEKPPMSELKPMSSNLKEVTSFTIVGLHQQSTPFDED
ncbi:hypothetical protein D0Y65_053122 [Glycine soja]|uniref:Uncharacterized protein n=1 Tax=Glycine soja TaxID=3848 RepID=A0A445F0R2_GLYSO|nr:hypothetical protein D0Y65_053122 [Glycine soja]